MVPQWNPTKVDYPDAIDDNDALAMMLRLSREDGIFAGISTGANVVGAYRLAERLGPDAVVVTLAVDTAFKYMSVSPLRDLRPAAVAQASGVPPIHLDGVRHEQPSTKLS